MPVSSEDRRNSAASGIVLTLEQIAMKTRQPPHHLTTLNLWGNNLSDISVLQSLTNIQVLALTVNQITSLRDLSLCTNLRELYLRRNFIPPAVSELRYLQELKQLKVLNLSENPICEGLPNYRQQVIKMLPWLDKLDDVPVTP